MPSTSANSAQSQSATGGLNISTLRRKRGHILGQISSLTTFLDYFEESNSNDTFLLQTHINGLNETWKKFDDIQFSIEELDESEGTRRFEIQNNYYAAVARANRLLHNAQTPFPSTSQAPNPSPVSIVSAPMAIKLPEMRLPIFDGSLEGWSPFYDLFSSTIDRNEDLTPVQKLQYLRSTLTGIAAECIQDLSTTDANYNDALAILKDKFDCPRGVILNHCDALRNFPKLTKDTPEALSKLLNTVNQRLRALKNLGEDITPRNSILLSILLSKLNTDTIRSFELTLKDKKKVPTYIELLEFIENRASCALVSSASVNTSTGRHEEKLAGNNHTTNKYRPVRGHAFLSAKTQRNQPYERSSYKRTARTESARQCPVCKEEHHIYACEKFHGLPVQDRRAFTDKAMLCYNCLQDGHVARRCTKSGCRICQKYHHTLLHRSTGSANLPSQTPADSSESMDCQETSS